MKFYLVNRNILLFQKKQIEQEEIDVSPEEVYKRYNQYLARYKRSRDDYDRSSENDKHIMALVTFSTPRYFNNFRTPSYEEIEQEIIKEKKLQKKQKIEKIENKIKELDDKIYNFIYSFVKIYIEFNFDHIFKNEKIKEAFVKYITSLIFKKFVLERYLEQIYLNNEIQETLFLTKKTLILIRYLLIKCLNFIY
jgi:hypothetical protein